MHKDIRVDKYGNKIKIIYRNKGLGERVDNKIYLHKNLKKDKFKYLHEQVLDHEITHNPKKGILYNLYVDLKSTFTLFDLEYDLFYLMFLIGHSSSWNQFLVYENGTLFPSLLVEYGLILLFLNYFHHPSLYPIICFLLAIHCYSILSNRLSKNLRQNKKNPPPY